MRRQWVLLMPIVLFTLVSCEYKDLCYDHNHYATLRLAFDWSGLEEAEVQGMTVLFYNIGDPATEAVRYDFSGMEGGTARLNPGRYRVVAYNYDTETILYRNTEAFNTLEAYTRYSSIEEGTQLTRSGMPRSAGTEEEPVILEPDMLYSATSREITLEQNDSTTIRLTPRRRFINIVITLNNVPNLNYTGAFGGALSGLAGSVNMSTGRVSEDCVTEAFPVSISGASTLKMQFHIFNHCPHLSEGIVNQHLLTIYAILSDGSKWYYTMDITQDIHDATEAAIEKAIADGAIAPTDDDTDDAIDLDIGLNEMLDLYIGEEINISIDDEVLPVPKPIVNGSGFQPTVDGWQGVEINVDM